MNNNIHVIDNPSINMVTGFRANGLYSGVKRSGNLDLGIVLSEKRAKTYGMYTTNKFQAAPLEIAQGHLKDNMSQLLVVNSGVANACTGDEGKINTIIVCNTASKKFLVGVKDVISMSTGVIGEQLPVDNINDGIGKLFDIIKEENDNNFSKAIMTTDTYPKLAGVKVNIGDKSYTIVGTAKGSGMINPTMATMLGFIFTDAAIDGDLLNAAFRPSIEKSFNSITVDGDMSTNDTVLIMANGMAENTEISDEESPEYKVFCEALNYITSELAKHIVKDGEGATKLIELKIHGAASIEDAKKAGKSIANSALVKTAFFGEDANWGRITCALGYSGAQFEPDNVTVMLENIILFQEGLKHPFREEDAKKILEQKDIRIDIFLNAGDVSWTVWTTDLSHDYIKINAGYRT